MIFSSISYLAYGGQLTPEVYKYFLRKKSENGKH